MELSENFSVAELVCIQSVYRKKNDIHGIVLKIFLKLGIAISHPKKSEIERAPTRLLKWKVINMPWLMHLYIYNEDIIPQQKA